MFLSKFRNIFPHWGWNSFLTFYIYVGGSKKIESEKIFSAAALVAVFNTVLFLPLMIFTGFDRYLGFPVLTYRNIEGNLIPFTVFVSVILVGHYFWFLKNDCETRIQKFIDSSRRIGVFASALVYVIFCVSMLMLGVI